MNLDRLNGVVVDVETGGLHPDRCALLEIGLLAISEGRIVAKWHTRVIPHPGFLVEPEAAFVNGYTPEWGGAEEGAVLRGVVDFLRWFQGSIKRKQLTWIGANVPFDREFVRAAAIRHGCFHDIASSFSHRDVDVARLAMIPLLAGAIKGIGLDVLRRDLLGLEKRGFHNALNDCEDTFSCLRTMMARMEWA